MKIKKRQKISVKNVVFVMCMVFILSLVISSLATAGQWATVADPKGIKTEFPQQLELGDYEKQMGKKLAFKENPMFAEKVKKGELPAVEKRLPAEPLVTHHRPERGQGMEMERRLYRDYLHPAQGSSLVRRHAVYDR
jgi:hypothetical protein